MIDTRSKASWWKENPNPFHSHESRDEEIDNLSTRTNEATPYRPLGWSSRCGWIGRMTTLPGNSQLVFESRTSLVMASRQQCLAFPSPSKRQSSKHLTRAWRKTSRPPPPQKKRYSSMRYGVDRCIAFSVEGGVRLGKAVWTFHLAVFRRKKEKLLPCPG